MKKQIDSLIEKHSDTDYGIYTLECNLNDFKLLQRLMSSEYKIKDFAGNNSMWKHNGTEGNPSRIGTVIFGNIELNVTCFNNYTDEPVFTKVEKVHKKFWNSKADKIESVVETIKKTMFKTFIYK